MSGWGKSERSLFLSGNFARQSLFFPREMREAPLLDPSPPRGAPVARYFALLINPFYPKDPYTSFVKHVLTPSLALTSVAAATPPHWTVEYHDENLLQEAPVADPVPQVVGITVHLTFAKRAYELARWFRERGSIVVMGGQHVQSCPDEVAEHADAIAVGEGVHAWPRILADIERGELKRVYTGSYRTQYREDPAPRRELVDRASFLTTSSVIATRGCHNRCDFCYLATDGLHMPYQTRRPEQVAEEIRRDGQPYVIFIDNNLGSRKEYLRRLCRALRPLEIIWSAAVTIDVTDDPTLVREMALSGCTGVFMGLETLSDANLINARKKTPRVADYARRVGIFHEYGIQVNGSFVFGFDDDGPDVFRRTVDWIEEHRLECATFHILTPYPGTPLFRRLEVEGRLLHRDWEQYDTAHVVYQPRRMSPEQLVEGYQWCYRELFSHRSIWARRPTDLRAVPAYLAMSYLYKRSNRFWHAVIKRRWTARAWRPLIEISRRRHLRFRKRLAAGNSGRAATPLSAGV